MFRHIGEQTIKKIYLKESGSKPMISEESMNALNEIIDNMTVFVLKKANDYRKGRGLTKRLERIDIEMAFKDYLILKK